MGILCPGKSEMEPSPEDNVLRGPKIDIGNLPGLGEALFNKLLHYGDGIALVDAETGDEETFKSLYSRSLIVALALKSLGVTIDDVVTVIEKPSPEAFAMVLGVMFTGAAINVLDAGWTAESMLPVQIPTLKPKVIFCHATVEDLLEKVLRNHSIKTNVIVYAGESNHGHQTYDKIVAEFEHSGDLKTYKPTSVQDIQTHVALIACTSGSSGPPKGVMVPDASMYQLIMPLKGANTEGMTMFTTSGMSWGSGIFVLISGVMGGAKRVFTKKSFSEENLLKVINKFKPKVMLLSCFQVSLLNAYLHDKSEEEATFSELRLLFAIGSKISPHHVETMQKRIPSGKLAVTYGLTESMGGTSTLSCPEYRPHTVGRPSINVEIKIVDLQTGENLGPHREGEVYIRGPTMIGYFGNPSATEEVLDRETGWLKTGDIGRYDEDGYIYITDRIKETAKYRGETINPSDIEDVLYKHPSVRCAAVVSIPHDEACDLMVGYVELRTGYKGKITAQELQTYCDENVPDYKRLRGGLYIVESLPVLVQGKIAKAKIKQMAKDMKDEIYVYYNNLMKSKY